MALGALLLAMSAFILVSLAVSGTLPEIFFTLMRRIPTTFVAYQIAAFG